MSEIQAYTQDVQIGDEIMVAGWKTQVIDIDKLTNEPSTYDIYFFLKVIDPIDSPFMQFNVRYGIPITVTRN